MPVIATKLQVRHARCSARSAAAGTVPILTPPQCPHGPDLLFPSSARAHLHHRAAHFEHLWRQGAAACKGWIASSTPG